MSTTTTQLDESPEKGSISRRSNGRGPRGGTADASDLKSNPANSCRQRKSREIQEQSASSACAPDSESGDLAALQLAEARHDSDYPAPLDVRLVNWMRRVKLALESNHPEKLATSQFLGEALTTLRDVAEIFIGWHERVERPTEVSIHVGRGELGIKVRRANGSEVTYQLDGTRWRSRPGGLSSTNAVALDIGRPIAYLCGLQDAMSSLFELTHFPDIKPEFVSTETAARIVGVTTETLRSWVSDEIVPYYLLPGQNEPSFRAAEIRTWAKEHAVRRGGLKPATIHVCSADPSRFAKLHEIPDCIRGISGLRDVPLQESLSGIYFLCSGGEVVYVGQSLSVLARVASHQSEGVKKFERAFFFPCPPSQLDETERQLIDALMPKYNDDGRTRSLRKAVQP